MERTCEMAFKSNPSQLSSPHSHTPIAEYPDEIDLVVLVSFLWRWRVWFLGLGFTGIVISNILYFSQTKLQLQESINGIWNIELNMEISESNSSPAVLNPIIVLLQSQKGSHILKTKAFKELPTNIEEALINWHSQWVSQSGKSQYSESSGNTFLMHIEGKENLNLPEYKTALSSGFSQILSYYNINVASKFEMLNASKIRLLKELGVHSLATIKSFLSNDLYSSQFKSDYIAPMLASSRGFLTLDQYTLLLSSIDSTTMDQKIAQYESLSHQLTETQLQLDQYQKEYPPLGPKPIEGTLKMSEPKFNPTPVTVGGVSSATKYNLVGLFLGLFAALFVTTIGQFLRSNRVRLRQALGKEP